MSTIDVNPGSWVVENRLAEAFAVGLDPAENAIFRNEKPPAADIPGFSALCHVT